MAINDDGGAAAGGLLEPGYGDVLWTPSPAVTERARITAYLRWLAAERDLPFDGYDALWRWSVSRAGQFLGLHLGLLRRARRPRAGAGAGRRPHARRALVQRHDDQLRP